MKRSIAFIAVICCLFSLCACSVKNAQDSSEIAQSSEMTSQVLTEMQSESVLFTETGWIDEALLGQWSSADGGERQMFEHLSFYENGSLVIELDYQGSHYGTLMGTFCVDGHNLLCSITEGADPYQVIYEYRIDGRMLILQDDDGSAEYLRTS